MVFKSRQQFFYLKYNHPSIWKDWINKYGVPKKLGLGTKKTWLAEDEIEKSSKSIEDIINSISHEALQHRYIEFIKELNQRDNKEKGFYINDAGFYFKDYLYEKIFKKHNVKNISLMCPYCLKEGDKNKIQWVFSTAFYEDGLEDNIRGLLDNKKTFYWNYCADCGSEIYVPKTTISEIVGNSFLNDLRNAYENHDILYENIDERLIKKLTLPKRNINASKRKLINNVQTENGQIKIHRALTAKRDWLDKPTSKNSIMERGLGIYWSFNKNKAIKYFSEQSKAKYMRDYKIHALADYDEVDWELTVLLNASDWDDEDEIRIIQGSPLDILEIEGLDKWFKPLDISSLPTTEIKASEDLDSEDLSLQINTIKGGLEGYKEVAQRAKTKSKRAYFKGLIASLDATIHGLKKVGLYQTLEEITVRLLPDSTLNIERLHNAGKVESDNYYYNVGKIKGYQEVLDYLSPYEPEWQHELASDTMTEEEYRDYTEKYPEISNVTNTDDNRYLAYGILIGIFIGTLSNFCGNLLSHRYLQNNR